MQTHAEANRLAARYRRDSEASAQCNARRTLSPFRVTFGSDEPAPYTVPVSTVAGRRGQPAPRVGRPVRAHQARRPDRPLVRRGDGTGLRNVATGPVPRRLRPGGSGD